jgi:hypothetical protein
MDDLELTPAGDSSPVVTLPKDSMGEVMRAQEHEVERHGATSGQPGSDFAGLKPGEIRLQGEWVGTNAESLASDYKTILNDETVDRVDVSGANSSTQYDGTYRISENARRPQPAPQTDLIYSYDIRLIED